MSEHAKAIARFAWMDERGVRQSVEDLPAAARAELAALVRVIEAIPDATERRRVLFERIEAGPTHVRMAARYLLWRQLYGEIWPVAFEEGPLAIEEPSPQLSMRNPGGMQ